MKGKKLNIGVVCYPSIGGSGVVATNLGIELARLGHRVHFISYERPFRLPINQKNLFFHKVAINEYRLFKYPDYTLPLAVKIENLHEKYAFDIVHVHYAIPHAVAANLARQICKHEKRTFPHIITTLHGTDITLMAEDPNLGPIIKYAIHASCGVTAVSQSLKTDTRKILKTKKPIRVIYNFYDAIKPKDGREIIRRRLNLKASDFLLVHISNLRPVKRIPDLLTILARLPKNFKLLILAGNAFKEYRPMAKKLKLLNRLIVKEYTRDLENYIPAGDLGIFTSEKESFGLGILECMAYGLPVVATRVGGVPEVLTDKKSGFLLKVGNIQGFVKEIKRLRKHPKKLERMGQNAKKIAEQKFNSKKAVQQYLDFYREIMDSHG